MRYFYDPLHEEIIVNYRLFGLKEAVNEMVLFKKQEGYYRYIRSKTVTDADAQHEFKLGFLNVYHNLNTGDLSIKSQQQMYAQLKDHNLIFFIDLSSKETFQKMLDVLHGQIFPIISRGRANKELPPSSQQKITLAGYSFGVTPEISLVQLLENSHDDFNLQIEIHPELITNVEQINPMFERMTENATSLNLSNSIPPDQVSAKNKLIRILRQICTSNTLWEKIPEGVNAMQEALTQNFYQPEDELLEQLIMIIKKRYSPTTNWFDAIIRRRQDKTSKLYSIVYHFDLIKLQQEEDVEEIISKLNQLFRLSPQESVKAKLK